MSVANSSSLASILQRKSPSPTISSMGKPRIRLDAMVITTGLHSSPNYVYYTAGRGPHTGGTSGYYQWVHITNNYFNNISGHAIDSSTGSVVLVEGNYFNSVTTPSVSGSAGNEYFMTSSSHVSTCTSTLGRTCQANTLASSGSVSHANTAVLTTLESQSAVVSYVPMAASAVPAFVLANAGTGKIN
ncbi:hypothetical protein FRC14_006369 [Serendipita sp. 396]|nr:hypothetical protein FRC14_006369 [Serendipita sp. 396]